MAEPSSSTPPPQQQQQEHPTRPTSFNTTWDRQDASFLQPSAIPLPKTHRAWERQPHSPFARNGRYRKVWKRYDLRSQPKAKSSAADMDKKSPIKSPRKIVKKRALDAPADPNATPGRKGPKNKAFAPTRWETPGRHSGRIASRKLAQPMFAKAAIPEPVHPDMSMVGAHGDTTMYDHEIGTESDAQPHDTQDKAGDQATTEDKVDSAAVPESSTPAAPESPRLSQPEDAEGQSNATSPTEDTSSITMVTERKQDRESIGDSEPPKLIMANLDSSKAQGDAKEADLEEPSEDMVVESESIVAHITCSEIVDPSPAEENKEAEVDVTTEDTETPAAPSAPSEDEKTENTSEDLAAPEPHPAEPDEEILMEDSVQQIAPKQEPSESPAIILDDFHQAENEDSRSQSAEESLQRLHDTSTEDKENQGHEVQFQTEHPLPESTVSAEQEGNSFDPEQLLQIDAALATASGSALEEDEESSLSTISDEETDETEQLGEDEYTLTELPDGEEGEDDGTSIPSPSLSAAESPRFSSIADTLTLNLPDRTPPKDRATKEVLQEPASPIDEDTAFLRDFLSRADASKASREAAASRLESINNRRDSDIVRQILSSPRVALEAKDPNSPSTATAGSQARKATTKDSELSDTTNNTPLTGNKKLDFLDLTSDLTLDKPSATSTEPNKTMQTPEPSSSSSSKPQSTRRSSRARQTRLSVTPSASSTGPNRITFRGTTEPVVLKKTEAQELAALTRNNTRRNKGGALAAPIRLNKLKAEALKKSGAGGSEGAEGGGELPVYADERIEVWKASRLRWDAQLVYFREEGEEEGAKGLVSLSDDEFAGEGALEKEGERKRKQKSDGDEESGAAAAATPARTKRARGLGAGNGTPAKGLLAPAKSLLPEGMELGGETTQAEEAKGKGRKSAIITSAASSSLSSSSTSGRSAATRTKKAMKEAPVDASAPAHPPTSSSNPTTTTAAQPPDAPSGLPAPPTSSAPAPDLSRRSRLQTPRKVKLPVPVSSTTSVATASANSHPPPSSSVPLPPSSTSKITGSTPRKMGGIGVAKPSGGGEGAAGSGGQGLSAGRRRAAMGRRV